MPPDKPKRKKNNKNKRKNKTSRSDNSKHVNASDLEKLTSENSPSDEKPHKEEITDKNVDVLIQTKNSSNNLNKSSQCDEISKQSSETINNESTTLFNADISLSSDFDNLHSPMYIVEDPEQKSKSKHKIGTTVKSKSLDNDDIPKIVEISGNDPNQVELDRDLAVIDSSTVIISEVEPDIEWEKTGDIIELQNASIKEVATVKLSITTIPLDVAHCDHTKCLTFNEEASLRNYLNTLNLSTQPENITSGEISTETEHIISHEVKHRLRKKASADDFFQQRLGTQRILDVIDEEGSGESSLTSRRQSYLSDKKSDNEDLDDDVFEDRNKSNDKFDTKIAITNRNNSFSRLVPQQCVLVGAKLKEPEITEARGNWTVKTMEKLTGAEVVYLTDSSSSTSSIHETGDETDDGIETDVSVRMITPTIEVTDTENLLKKSFISPDNDSVTNKLTISKSVESEEHIEHAIKIDFNTDQDNIERCSSIPTSHEIVVFATDDIKTDLYVKDIDENKDIKITQSFSENLNNNENIKKTPLKEDREYDLELKVIKCELNDAINNLLKEVSSDSDINNDTFNRQDSSSSIGSSQCTAKYNPDFSSLNDVSNITHDEKFENSQTDNSPYTKSHVKNVIECVSEVSTMNDIKIEENSIQPRSLKTCCVSKIASLPYGEKILEELASVSQSLHNLNILRQNVMEEITDQHANKMVNFSVSNLPSTAKVTTKINKNAVPPPVKPRRSSLIKIKPDDKQSNTLNSLNESFSICQSPSQNLLMKKTNKISKEDISDVIQTQKRFVELKRYDEDKDIERGYTSDNPPVVSFKSQTGSRLLALIRDPKITSNVNSRKNSYNCKSDQFEDKFSDIKSSLCTYEDRNSTFKELSAGFKPIPPPRPTKLSSSVFESDESYNMSNNSLRSIKNEQKLFHYSTGNLNKEIENDVSIIQSMHKFHTNVRDQLRDVNYPRRPSLPKDLCDQQMEYIRKKEKEVDAEIQRLEEKSRNAHNIIQRRGPRAPLISEKKVVNQIDNDMNYCSMSHKNDINTDFPYLNREAKLGNEKISSVFSSSQEEIQREKMYSEYINEMAERHERKQHRIIKITKKPEKIQSLSKSLSDLEFLGSKINNPIEKEFISKARQRWTKLGIKDPETEDEKESDKNIYKEPKVIQHKIKIVTEGEEKEIHKLPSHLQEFVRFTAKEKERGSQSPGESEPESASPQTVIWCAVIVIIIAIVKYFLRILRNK